MKLKTGEQSLQPEENLTQDQFGRSFSVNRMVISGLVVLLIVAAAGVCYSKIRGPENLVSEQPTVQLSERVFPTNTVSPSDRPYRLLPRGQLGLTTWSFADVDGNVYLRQTIDIVDDKASCFENEAKTVIRVYSEDESYEPNEVTSDMSGHNNWIDVLQEPIEDIAGTASVLVADRLFSFKRVVGSSNFLFVVELRRMTDALADGRWVTYQNKMELYLYDQGKKELRKIITFPNEISKYFYPKISSFGGEGRYVLIEVFACWSCGGHVPETFLVDLQTFKMLNLGKVSYFSWREEGNYEYKDFVLTECEGSYSAGGECFQDPNTLFLKTGKI